MHRRRFLTGALAGAASFGPAAATASAEAAPRARMKAGHQHHSSDADLRLLAALGVRHICSALPSRALDEHWSVDGLSRLRKRVERFGIRLDMVPLPLSNTPVRHAENPNLLLGKSPERDREIDRICEMIRNAARAGIPAVKYNLTLLGVLRTASTRGRGGARYSTFVYKKADDGPPSPDTGRVDADEMWERIAYFLKRVVPVAEECKVRLCCHPHDPAVPRRGFRGVACVLGSVDGLKRFIDLVPSKYHGLNFCQGSVAEMLREPGREIYDVIRYFGGRGKIFNVHFRNIKGGYLSFQETFPDDGAVDMLRAMRVYQEVGYDGMIMPDHVPQIDGDSGGTRAFAFAFGYIRALIRMVGGEEGARRQVYSHNHLKADTLVPCVTISWKVETHHLLRSDTPTLVSEWNGSLAHAHQPHPQHADQLDQRAPLRRTARPRSRRRAGGARRHAYPGPPASARPPTGAL